MNTNNADMEDGRKQLPEDPSSSTGRILVSVAAADAEGSTRSVVSFAPQDIDRAEEHAYEYDGGLPPTSTLIAGDYDEEKDRELESLRRVSNVSIGEREINKRCLPEDTFSFLIYSRVNSWATFWAIGVFCLQITIYIIIGINIIDIKNNKNPVNFPPNVEIPVRISQVLAIEIAIITQTDVRKAVSLYRDGFGQDLANAFEGATVVKWSLSIALRASQGLLGLTITFLLIMRSSTVLDLLLNFSAIEFVSNLDNVVFELASEGFLGMVLKMKALSLSNKCYNTSYYSAANSQAASIATVAYSAILFVAFYSGWLCIFMKQEHGEYLCDQIFAQFGDEVLRMLGTFSGLLYRQNKSFGGYYFGARLSYAPENFSDDGGPLLAYCNAERRWTLSLHTNLTENDEPDPCNWLAASTESTAFNVLLTASSPWIVKTPKQRVLPLTQHFLACYDEACASGNCVRADNKSENGCKDGYYGLLCEKQEPPCQSLEIDSHSEGFVKAGGRYFASKYYRLKGVETYNHPVYTSLGDKDAFSDDIDFIFFTGVRWILSYKPGIGNIERDYLFPGLKDIDNEDGIVQYFKQFHARNFTDYSVSFYSEPVHIVTLADVDDTASPLGVRWFPYTQKDVDQWLHTDLEKDSIETSFFCAVCNQDTNPCQKGVCLSNGTCGRCPYEYSGSRCEIPPDDISNGQCDPRFNNITFEFDGGDCCDNTCRSTPEHTCGKADLGYVDTGYPFCKSASDQWQLSGDPIHGMNSVSRSGQAVALSGKGTVLAVADPGVSIVRLFDKDGREWKQRGQLIQDLSDSSFGSAISLSDESFNITRNAVSSPPLTLAVGAPKLGLVRVFKCSTSGCIQKGEDITGGFRFGNSLSIAKDGDSVAIGGAARELITPTGTTTNGEVKVFTWSNDMNDWQLKGNGTIVRRRTRKLSDPLYQFDLHGYYVSLSGDYLATGTLEGEITPEPRYESVSLITQVYKWDDSRWNQLGDDISKVLYDEASVGAPWPHRTVVVKEGILAIGSKSSVDVYSWNETSREWIQREVELSKSSEATDFVGWSVDLSEDANILSVGTSLENTKATDESFVQMYKWDDESYKALFNGVLGGPGNSVSLSSDGKAVAVGLPFDAEGGSTRVYSFHPSSPCNGLSEIPLRISFTTDANPEETSWELRVDSEVKRSSGSLAGYMYTTFVEEMCVPTTSCVRFIVYDTLGNGLSPPGVFSLMLNGTEVAQGGNFEFFHVTSVGNCECSEDEAKFTLATWSNFKPVHWSLINQNTLKPYTGLKLVPSEDSFFTVVDECIPKDCYYLSSQKDSGDDNDCTVVYSAVYNGESILPSSKYGRVFCNLSGYKFGEC